MSKAALIERSDEILGGTPVFAGTRVPAQTLLDYLEAGDSLDEFLDDFPTVEREQAIAVLELLEKRRQDEDFKVSKLRRPEYGAGLADSSDIFTPNLRPNHPTDPQ